MNSRLPEYPTPFFTLASSPAVALLYPFLLLFALHVEGKVFDPYHGFLLRSFRSQRLAYLLRQAFGACWARYASKATPQ